MFKKKQLVDFNLKFHKNKPIANKFVKYMNNKLPNNISMNDEEKPKQNIQKHN